jgi:hypothetical protein
VLLQRTRTDWYSLTETMATASDAKAIGEKLTQKNVLTAIGKLKYPPTSFGKTAQAQYEVICDFVHPNRGSHSLFVKQCVVEDGIVTSTYSRDPRSSDLTQVVLEVTSSPLLHSIVLMERVHERWRPLDEHLIRLIDGSRIYLL